ncbi:benzoate/H(+) symporter BenE family transporter, partial [Vibrio cholerae]
DEYREPALLTFVITLSGATLFGMSATLIGLVIGLAYLRLTTRPRP